MLLHPSYFTSIIQYVAIVNGNDLLFEIEDNYQKQTYRNRCYIYGANGKQLLTVPIIHTKTNDKLKTKDVKIDNSFQWQKLHLKALQSAYRSSPYFEFYEDDILEIFNKEYEFLLDLNFETIAIISDCMQFENSIHKTTEYRLDGMIEKDYRYLANAKNAKEYSFKNYTQVFDDKHGFIPNLSIMDLLFNEGPNALEYIESHKNLLF